MKKINICFYSRSMITKVFSFMGKRLEDLDIQTCYIIHDQKDEDKLEQDGCKNKRYNLTEYIEKNWNNDVLLSSVDLEMIEKKYEIESLWSIFYTDRFLIYYTYEEAIKFIKLHISFYLDIIEKEAIDFFVYENISHFSAYIFFIIGKFHNVRYLGFSEPRNFADKKFTFTNNENSTNYKLNQYYEESDFPDQELIETREFIKNYRIHKSRPEYMDVYGQEPKLNYQILKGILKYPKYLFKKKNFFDYMRYKDKDANPLRSFKSYLKYNIHKLYYQKSNEKDKFYLFPLHFQPEATTLVNAQNYEKQLNAIDLLAKKIPIGTKLYVKEHYADLGHRELDFYSKLKIYPNVRLIDPWENSRELIEKSIAVITLAGTVGWEAILLKKPVFLLGNMFYSNFKYTNKINNIDELPNRLKNHSLLELDDQDYEDELELYVASYLKSLQDGSFIIFSPDSVMSEKNLGSLYKSFMHELELINNE